MGVYAQLPPSGSESSAKMYTHTSTWKSSRSLEPSLSCQTAYVTNVWGGPVLCSLKERHCTK